jgi:Ca2+-binding RTX toxin-like protein
VRTISGPDGVINRTNGGDNSGGETIFGLSGSDQIDGGLGNDTLHGGDVAYTRLFTSARALPPAALAVMNFDIVV